MSEKSALLAIGAPVIINCPGHRHDGRTGSISYRGEFFGTWGVDIDGQTFGFLPSEMKPA